MATVLLANQWGGGVGHAHKLLLLADELLSRGHRAVIAVPDLVAVQHAFRGSRHKLLQGPVWQGRVLKRRPTRSFSDIMANQGFADARLVAAIADAWGNLIDWVQPDLVIADYAPILCLAVRDRLPLVVVGVSFCVPPGNVDSFPVLNPEASKAFPDEVLLAICNAWLQANNRSPLQSLPQIHPDEHSFAFGLPELDPYADYPRLNPVRPLQRGSKSPLAQAASNASVFAYLSAQHRSSMQLLVRLAESGLRLEVCLRDYRQPVARDLAQRGIIVHDRHVPITDALARSRLYLHHGSGGAAEDALLLGRPQICLTHDLEKRLTATMLQSLGVGVAVRGKEIDELGPARVHELCEDERLQQRASEFAAKLHTRDYSAVLPELLDKIESRLQQGE